MTKNYKRCESCKRPIGMLIEKDNICLDCAEKKINKKIVLSNITKTK